MASESKPVDCYIAAYHNSHMDPYFEKRGFSRGLILFAIPSYGILFRCRAEGDTVDLEFGAFFALLRFVKTRLEKQKISKLVVYSSNPEFVFSFAGYGRHIARGSARDKLIREYGQTFNVAVSYVEPRKNQSLVASADFPSMPAGRELPFKPASDDSARGEFKPILKGLKI